MDRAAIEQVRRFNRAVTLRVGTLEESYLSRGRPLSEARVIFETGAKGVDMRVLRGRLGLDSGYLSRLLGSLKTQGLARVDSLAEDRRARRVSLTPRGRRELAAYERLSDRLAQSVLAALDPPRRDRLIASMGEVERLIRAAAVKVRRASPGSAVSRWCLGEYYRELGERFEGGFDPAEGNSDGDKELIPPAGDFVVAWLAGEPVGCGGLKREAGSAGEIKRVWTAPSARGIGVARKVLRALEAVARKQELGTLRLDTNRALNEARAFYRSEGYQEIARYNDNPYAHHWFEKRL